MSADDPLVWAVNTVTGKSLGTVARSTLGVASGVEVIGPHPVGAQWTYSFATGQWMADLVLADVQSIASDSIDVAAGEARLRYITECAGQDMTYLRKEDAARAYIASGNTGTVPPFVQAEADAMGSTPADAAALIVATADAWANTVGPNIEKIRRQGKIAVAAATTIADVQSIVTAYVGQLAAI